MAGTQDKELSGPGGSNLFSIPGHADHQSWAAVKIPQGLHTWVRYAITLFLLIALAICFVPWTQTITVRGQLSAYSVAERPQEVHAQINARLSSFKVSEGTFVKQGELIIELEDVMPTFIAPDLLMRLGQSREAVKGRRQAAMERADILGQRIKEMNNLIRAALETADARVNEAGNKVQASEQRVVAAKIALETANLNLDRSQVLEAEGLISRRELELAIQSGTAAAADLKAAEALLREAQQARKAMEQNRDQVDAEMVQRLLDTRSQRASALAEAASASKELADLELTLSNATQRRNMSHVLAPRDGTVVRLTRIGIGEVVKPGDLLFTIVPQSPSRAVEMWAESIDAPLLRPGRPVRLLFHGVPAIPLSAWPELMAGTFEGVIQVVDQFTYREGKFRIWVAPDKEKRPWPPQDQVRQGTQTMGWIILNRVPLWYELWRRFNLFPPDYEQGGAGGLLDLLLPKSIRPGK